MKIVDTHTHIGRYGEWDCALPDLIALMDANGVEKAVTGCMESSTLGASGFEGGLERISGYEDRLRLMLWVDPARPDDAGTAREVLKRFRKSIACVKAHPQTAQVPLNDPRWLPCIRLCEETGLPFVSHTEPGAYASVEQLAALAREHPAVNFVAVHMELRGDHVRAAELIARCPNLYGDTTFLPAQDVRAAVDLCGAEKVLFGSDAPILPDRYAEKLRQLMALLAPREAEAVFFRNAERLFDLG